MSKNRKGGVIELKIDGQIYSAKGNFEYSLGKVKREAIVGHDSVHGYKELPTVPYISGEITDSNDLSLDKLANVTNATVTLSLANSKIIVLRGGWMVNDDGLVGNSEEGNIPVRFEGMSAEEVR